MLSNAKDVEVKNGMEGYNIGASEMYKRCLIYLLFVLLCVLKAPAQASSSAGRESVTAQQLRNAEAAWPAFFAAFRKALRKRNHKALRLFLTDDYNHDSERTRDEAIRDWYEDDLWRDILSAKGGELFKEGDTIKHSASFTTRRSGISCVLYFEFHRDGKWYLADLGCDTE